MRHCVLPLVAIVSWIAVAESTFAAPFVELVHPPALQRGTVNRVTVRGTELNQAVGVWSSVSGTAWSGKPVRESSATEAVFEMTIPSETPLGIVGMRLVTKSGFSNVSLLLIDELPITTRPVGEDEEQFLTLPVCVAAICRPAKTDRFAITVSAGQRVGIDLIGSRLGKDFDPFVTIHDASGRIVARRDNDQGLFFDCRFAHTFEAAGKYLVEVRDARFEGRDDWNYVLRMGDFPAARVAIPSAITLGKEQRLTLPELAGMEVSVTAAQLSRVDAFFQEVRATPTSVATWIALSNTALENQFEVEPNDDIETATLVTVPANVNGVLSKSREQDFFRFELKKGQTLAFEGVARAFGSPADLELALFDNAGKEVRRADDVTVQRNGVSTTHEARFDFNVGQDGVYKLLVRDLAADGGTAFAYRIEVKEPRPMIELHAEYSAFTVPKKSWQPIPITVTRTRIAGPVELELIGAPAGVTLEPRTIPAEANEIVCRLIASEAAPESVSTMQIVGKCQSEDGKLVAESLVQVTPMIDRQLRNKDRIPYSLRDNQTQLPPSLPTRLALLVTPPAPFELEVPFESLLVTKYVPTPFQLRTVRANGFTAPISITATGGQIGSEADERDNIYLKIAAATAAQPTIEGVFVNRILTQYGKKRADLTAIAEFEGHRVALIRTFDMDVRSAFKPSFETPTVSVEPGKTVKVTILANRTSHFSGPVEMRLLQPAPGLQVPEVIPIPANTPSVEWEVVIPADMTPRRIGLRFQSTGYVGKYEEELNEPTLNIDIVKPKS